MSEYNYGPLEHELAGGQCADDCHFGDRDEPPAPRAGESDEWRVHRNKREIVNDRGFYVAFVTDELTATQIVTEHNQHATLIEQQRFLEDRLAAQTESLAKVVSERNRLREQHEQLVAALKQLMIRFEQTGEAWMSDPAMVEARALLATIEREGV